MPQKRCPQCGKLFSVKESHSDKRVTCSRRCWSLYKFEKVIQRIESDTGQFAAVVLYQLYIVEQKSYRDICKELQINNRTVPKLLKRFNIPIRHGSEAVKTQWSNGKHNNQSGKDHYFWRGGITFSVYHDMPVAEWYVLTNTIRERDNNTCTRCGMTADACLSEFGCTLDVHHIVPYRLSKSNEPSNLRTVCVKCHAILERSFHWLL